MVLGFRLTSRTSVCLVLKDFAMALTSPLASALLGVTQQTPGASYEEAEGQDGQRFGMRAAFIRPGVAARHKTRTCTVTLPRIRRHVRTSRQPLNAVANGQDAIANTHIEEAVNKLQADAPDAPKTAASVIEANRAINARNAAAAAQHVANARELMHAAENEQRQRNRKGKAVVENNAGPSQARPTQSNNEELIEMQRRLADSNGTGTLQPQVIRNAEDLTGLLRPLSHRNHGQAQSSGRQRAPVTLGPRKTILKVSHRPDPRRTGRISKPTTRYASGVYPPRGGRSAQNMRMYSDPPRNRWARAHIRAALDAVASGQDTAIANAHIEEAVDNLHPNAPDAHQTAASVVEANNAIKARNAAAAAQHIAKARVHLQAAENGQREGKAAVQNSGPPSATPNIPRTTANRGSGRSLVTSNGRPTTYGVFRRTRNSSGRLQHHKSVSKGGGKYGWKACSKEAYNKSTTEKKINMS
jgi:hypothetical protein